MTMKRLTTALSLALVLTMSAVANASDLGAASYYDDGSGLYAAVPSYTFGDARYELTVCRQDNVEVCVKVTVRDHCQCYVGTINERIIDLSPEAFSQIAPLSDGLVRVVIKTDTPNPVSPTLPPTDTGLSLLDFILTVVALLLRYQ